MIWAILDSCASAEADSMLIGAQQAWILRIGSDICNLVHCNKSLSILLQFLLLVSSVGIGTDWFLCPSESSKIFRILKNAALS
jgi:hypothetical protein